MSGCGVTGLTDPRRMGEAPKARGEANRSKWFTGVLRAVSADRGGVSAARVRRDARAGARIDGDGGAGVMDRATSNLRTDEQNHRLLSAGGAATGRRSPRDPGLPAVKFKS